MTNVKEGDMNGLATAVASKSRNSTISGEQLRMLENVASSWKAGSNAADR